MNGIPWRAASPSRGGFTLIEVIGALVIFSVGVLMVIQLSNALSARMAYSAQTSEIVVRAHERLDSLEALPFDSLVLGSAQDTFSVRGTRYLMVATVSQVTGILYQLDVSMTPSTAGAGPTYSVTSYAAAEW